MLENAAFLTLKKAKILKMFEEDNIEIEISLLFTDDLEIQELNAQYRHKNCPTDVLSFPLEGDLQSASASMLWHEQATLLLGDIIISLEMAQRQADKYNHSLEREICFLFVHGLLHLLGYDHLTTQDEAEMRSLQTAVLAELGQAR